MKKILITILTSYCYTVSAQFLGSISPGLPVYDYEVGSGIQLNNGNLLFVNSLGYPNQFNKVHNLLPAGGFYSPQTPQTPNSIPVIIKHMGDDRYVIATYHANIDPYTNDTLEISRHLPDGIYDSAFNSNGKYFRVINSSDELLYPYDLIILKDSSVILSFATASGPAEFKVRALKLKPNGIIDSTFGLYGAVSPPLDFIRKPFSGNYPSASIPMLEDNNDHIYFAGEKGYKKCLLRYNKFGVFDSTYGYKISSDSGDISRLMLDYSGDIIAAGCNNFYGGAGQEPFEWFVRKYKPDGTLNMTFGINGEFNIPAFLLSNAFLQPDGKVLLFGQSSYKGNIYGKRIHANGTIDNTFSINTSYVQCGNWQDNFIGTSFIQADGNIIYTVGFTNLCTSAFHINRIANNPCGNGNAMSSMPVLSANNLNFCQGVATNDTIFISGNLNAASNWEYYTNFDPVPVQVYGNSFAVNPTVSITYFVRGAGYCTSPGPVESIIINVMPTTTSTTNATACINQLPYLWNGLSLDSPGVCTVTLANANANGCDSIAKLNFNISNCGLCQANINVNWTPYLDSLTESQTWITTSGTILIPAGAKVKFDADTSGYVTINPGFKAEYGSVFVAQAYNGCTAGAPQLPQFGKIIPDLQASSEIVLYPNPTTGMIHIMHDENLKSIQIFDMVGKLIISQKCEGEMETNIDLSNLPNGVYHVKTAGYNSIKVVKHN